MDELYIINIIILLLLLYFYLKFNYIIIIYKKITNDFIGIPGKPGLDGERGATGPPGSIGSQVSSSYKICNIIILHGNYVGTEMIRLEPTILKIYLEVMNTPN